MRRKQVENKEEKVDKREEGGGRIGREVDYEVGRTRRMKRWRAKRTRQGRQGGEHRGKG